MKKENVAICVHCSKSITACKCRYWLVGGVYRLFLLGVLVAASGCAVSRHNVTSPDGTVLKGSTITTIGSRITGKDLQMGIGVDSDGAWRATTGEQVEEMSSEMSAIIQAVIGGLVKSGIAVAAP